MKYSAGMAGVPGTVLGTQRGIRPVPAREDLTATWTDVYRDMCQGDRCGRAGGLREPATRLARRGWEQEGGIPFSYSSSGPGKEGWWGDSLLPSLPLILIFKK